MQKFQDLKSKKYTLWLLQIIALGVFFVLIFQQEAVFIVKEILSRLNIGHEIEFILAKSWASFKIIINSPSLIGLFYFVIQLMCATYVIFYLISFVFCPRAKIESNIKEKDEIIDRFIINKKCVYLENSRLLI